MTFRLPGDETLRLESLRAHAILDTPPEPVFDDLTCLATRICGVPMAAIVFVDEGRAWFKSCIGIEAPYWARADSFCRETLFADDALVVRDASVDERFSASPVVTGEPYVRFYAGVPLRTTDDHVIGTLCVMDRNARELTSDQLDSLRGLARLVMGHLRRQTRRQELFEEARLYDQKTIAAFNEEVLASATNAIAAIDTNARFLYVNRWAAEITGYSRDEMIGMTVTQLVPPDRVAEIIRAFEGVAKHGERVDGYETEIVRKDGSRACVSFSLGALVRDGEIIGIAGTAEDITERKRSEATLLSQHRLLELIATGAPVDEILTAIAVAAEEQSGARCSIMLLDNHDRLHCAAAPSFPASLAVAFDGLAIGPNAGSCGTAAFRGAPVITRDIEADPFWEAYREVMRPHGLRSCWSTPIIVSERTVVGTVALYSPEPGTPNERQQHVIEIATHLSALAIEQSRGRKVLAESESRYQALAENAFDLVCELDEDYRIVYVSPNYTQVLGYEPAELIGRVGLELIHEDDRVRVVDEFTAAVEDPEAGMVAFRFLRKDGAWCWSESSANEFVTPDGEPRIVIVSRDVSERVAMEESLRENDARLHAFIENAPVLLFGVDRNGIVTLAEGSGATLLNISRLVGLPIDVAFARRPDIVANVKRALGGEEFTAAADAAGRQYEVHHRPVIGLDGEIGGMIGVAVDITERHRAQEALRTSEERLRTFVENAPALFYALDRSGTFTLCDGTILETFGLRPGELVGASVFDVHDGRPDLQDAVRRTLAGEEMSMSFELDHHVFEAHHKPVLGADGEITGMIGIAFDVTDRVRAESLVAAQRELLEMIAVGAPLTDVLTRVIEAVENHDPAALCVVALIRGDREGPRQIIAPSLPPDVDGRRPGPGDGSGAPDGAALDVFFRHGGNDVVVSRDIASDPAWEDECHGALAMGLRSFWSMPIVSPTGAVLGALAMFHRQPHEPAPPERELASIATHVAGIAIERQRAERAVRQRATELDRMYKRLVRAHSELEESKVRLEEKSRLLELSLATEREQGRHDPLTGALNHAGITDVLRESIAEADTRGVALAMVDVDGLKVANDTYGHQVGDAVLLLVAQKLMRDGAIVGRYGGDEFLAVLPGHDRRLAEGYRDSVLAAINDGRLVDEQTGAHVPVAISIGLATYPEEAGAIDDLIRLSDSAMYASRRARADGPAGNALSRTLGGDRAAKMVGEIVPLLTSAGELGDKLRLVSHRLSVGAGYDAVNFVLEDARSRQLASSAFARVPEGGLEEWNKEQRGRANEKVTRMLERTRRPIIMSNLATEELVRPKEREMLLSVGLRSALVAPMFWQNDLIGALSVASKRLDAFSVRDAEFVQAVATQVTAIVRMSSLVDQLQSSSSQLRQAHEDTVLMLASAAEAHDHTTGRHLARVRDISEALARELGYDEEAAHALGLAATLHDIGKVRVPDSVLGSSNALAEAEWVLMKQHTIWGSAFLSGQHGFELAATVARYHHERWDGAGYPDGLAGDQIPEEAQITTVADSFDAMTSDRPYRAGRPVEEAVREIVSCAGTQFNPRVVDALVRLHDSGSLDLAPAGEDIHGAFDLDIERAA